MNKTIESFCCHEKALEYDEYDDLLTGTQNQGLECIITSLSSFIQNMLSKDVLAIDVSQYLEQNWPDIYKRISCIVWFPIEGVPDGVFAILGKKCRRVFLLVFTPALEF